MIIFVCRRFLFVFDDLGTEVFFVKETAQRLPNQDAAVFLLNNFHPLRSTLSLYQSDDKRLQELANRMEACLADLVKEQTVYILMNLELTPILSIISKVSFIYYILLYYCVLYI